MKLSELENRAQQAASASRYDTAEQREWHIDVYDAPFEFLHVSTSAKAVTEVSSVDKIAERFLEGGGDIIRSKLEIPGIGSLITCADSIGQRFSFIEEDQPDVY